MKALPLAAFALAFSASTLPTYAASCGTPLDFIELMFGCKPDRPAPPPRKAEREVVKKPAYRTTSAVGFPWSKQTSPVKKAQKAQPSPAPTMAALVVPWSLAKPIPTPVEVTRPPRPEAKNSELPIRVVLPPPPQTGRSQPTPIVIKPPSPPEDKTPVFISLANGPKITGTDLWEVDPQFKKCEKDGERECTVKLKGTPVTVETRGSCIHVVSCRIQLLAAWCHAQQGRLEFGHTLDDMKCN